MTALGTTEHNGFLINVTIDDDSAYCNPRENASNLGTFWTMERRYKSPDAMPVRGNVFESMAKTFNCAGHTDSIESALDRKAVWLPVWKYEHGAVAYAAATSNPFHCEWDSGQAGYVFVTLADVRKEYGVTRVTKAIRAKALEVLRQEVETYSQWANGEVYAYTVTDANGEETDSCGGFIGDAEYALAQAKECCA